MIKCIFALACLLVMASTAFAQEARRPPKVLITYFSHTNNTRTIAEMIQKMVGGDMFRVARKAPYPQVHQQTDNIAKDEHYGNARPELAQTISAEDMKQYDVIFVGFPSWYHTLPMVYFTFLEQYDLSGKILVPFCTHEGSGLGNGPNDLNRLQPNARVVQGLALRGRSVRTAENDVRNWLRNLGFIR